MAGNLANGTGPAGTARPVADAAGRGVISTPERQRDTTASRAPAEQHATTPPAPSKRIRTLIDSDSDRDRDRDRDRAWRSRRRRRLTGLTLAVVLTGMVGAVGTAGATTGTPTAGPVATAATVTGCAVPSVLAGERSPAGTAWATTPATRAVVEDLGAALEQTFGPAGGKQAGNPRLARGLIGITMDDASGSVVVVVDPALVDRQALATSLARSAGATGRQAAGAGPAVEVRPACFSARELHQARAVLAGRQWHPDARTTTYAFHLDAADSRFHVSFSPAPADRAVAAALERALGDRVAVEFDAPALFSGTRANDASPHFGGAFITPGFVDRAAGCSSGFTVNFADGRRGMVSARHCFDLANNFEPGLQLFSGIEEFASVDGLKLGFPAFDMMRMTQPGQSYANVLHTDPCCPSQRTVTGKADPVQNELLCVSGQLTGARCSVKVINPSGSFCPSLAEAPEWGGECTHDVLIAERAGVQVAKRGDSGAPVYLPLAGNTASIRGMLIGGNGPGTRIFAEKVSNIEQFLQVTVATF